MAMRVLCRGLIEGPPEPAGLRDEGTAAGRPAIPPTVKRGEHDEAPAQEHVELVLSDGTVKLVERRTGRNGKVGFIDWLNVTFHEMTAHNLEWGTQISDELIVTVISAKLEEILGFGVTSKCERGRNFYERAYELGEGLGFVCHGGQRGSVLVMLNGHGLAAARLGWEERLHEFLTTRAVKPKITRCDVAHDCFDGEYTVDRALADYDADAYRCKKAPQSPDCEQRGNWRRPNGKGRSFYVGHRTSGKFLRIYEKGKQLGSPASEWVRVECEYKSADRVIPFDILLNPGAYLAGAYPALEWIEAEQERIRTIRETIGVEKERKEAWIHQVCGADLHVLAEMEPGDSPEQRAFNLIQRLRNESKYPKWATVPTDLRGRRYIHEEITTAAECVQVDYRWAADAFERSMQDAI